LGFLRCPSFLDPCRLFSRPVNSPLATPRPPPYTFETTFSAFPPKSLAFECFVLTDPSVPTSMRLVTSHETPLYFRPVFAIIGLGRVNCFFLDCSIPKDTLTCGTPTPLRSWSLLSFNDLPFASLACLRPNWLVGNIFKKTYNVVPP